MRNPEDEIGDYHRRHNEQHADGNIAEAHSRISTFDARGDAAAAAASHCRTSTAKLTHATPPSKEELLKFLSQLSRLAADSRLAELVSLAVASTSRGDYEKLSSGQRTLIGTIMRAVRSQLIDMRTNEQRSDCIIGIGNQRPEGQLFADPSGLKQAKSCTYGKMVIMNMASLWQSASPLVPPDDFVFMCMYESFTMTAWIEKYYEKAGGGATTDLFSLMFWIIYGMVILYVMQLPECVEAYQTIKTEKPYYDCSLSAVPWVVFARGVVYLLAKLDTFAFRPDLYASAALSLLRVLRMASQIKCVVPDLACSMKFLEPDSTKTDFPVNAKTLCLAPTKDPGGDLDSTKPPGGWQGGGVIRCHCMYWNPNGTAVTYKKDVVYVAVKSNKHATELRNIIVSLVKHAEDNWYTMKDDNGKEISNLESYYQQVVFACCVPIDCVDDDDYMCEIGFIGGVCK